MIALVGCGYTVAATLVLRRFLARRPPAPIGTAAVTVMKPLHGAEPHLRDNLATFLAQRHDGPIQLLCGVARTDDPAVGTVAALRRDHPDARIDLIVDATVHGRNGKVSNLVNMAPHIAHDTIVLSDSDMAVPDDYLARLIDTLGQPGVGAATCLYRGRGDAGGWSRLGAAGSSWQFLPNTAFAVATGLARPCMGSTIALTRATLATIGGFAAFADTLADDHAIGAAVARAGGRVVVPPVLLAHAADDASFRALWRHELRWAVTVRRLQPVGYAGSVIAMPLPLGGIALALSPSPLALAALGAALVTRLAAAATADGIAAARTAPLWWLPLRDALQFAVYVASFFTRSVEWRGHRMTVDGAGRIAGDSERP